MRKIGEVEHFTLLPDELNACRSDEKLVPDRAVGRITWESFLRQRA
ncbi:MAG TPA: hypothetical protein VHZ51_21785 [Ktedonobacteraceae bacterium]|nr:hypothetical protein [Ktedonobacteraceae bacterium]